MPTPAAFFSGIFKKCELPLSPAQSSDVGYSADALPSLNPRTQKFTDSVNMEIHLSVSMKDLSLEVERDFIIIKSLFNGLSVALKILLKLPHQWRRTETC